MISDTLPVLAHCFRDEARVIQSGTEAAGEWVGGGLEPPAAHVLY